MIHFQVSKSLKLSEPGLGILQAQLEHAALTTLEDFSSLRDADLTLVLSDDAQLQKLNREYLGIDETTDVLSFPNGEIDLETDRIYAGDLIISYPQAAAQAAAGGHSLEAELQLLVVHGVLHLCGYDHAEAKLKAVMWQKQAKILGLLKNPILGPPDDLKS